MTRMTQMLRRTSAALLAAAVLTAALPAAHARQPAAAPTAATESRATEPRVVVYNIAPLLAQTGEGITVLAARIGSAAAVGAVPITDTLIAITGNQRQQEAVAKILNDVAAQNTAGSAAPRHVVELIVVEVPADTAPRSGEPMPAGKSLARIQHTVREVAAFESIRTEAYIARWQPVVADNAVGYDSTIEKLHSGLRAQVKLGPAAGSRIPVAVLGQFSRGTITTLEQPLAQGQSLSIGLPRVDQRSIHAESSVQHNAAVVMSVTEGFEPGTALVVGIRITPAG